MRSILGDLREIGDTEIKSSKVNFVRLLLCIFTYFVFVIAKACVLGRLREADSGSTLMVSSSHTLTG